MQKTPFWILLMLAASGALNPNLAAKSTEKVLHRFTGGTDGGSPSSSLVFDSFGNLYGTTSSGGDLSQCDGYGCGTVFELTVSKNGKWQEHVLYAFEGGVDGSFPMGNLVFDTTGNLYGTTPYGGTGTKCSQGCGTVFELSPNPDGSWTETVLYDFQGEPDGAVPEGLSFGASGSLFGLTAGGGDHDNGTAYELSPNKQTGGAWRKTTLYGFSAQDGTLNPGLVFDGQGNLYGTYYNVDVQFCFTGSDCGAVFQLKQVNGNWMEADLHDFPGGGNGGQPAAGVIGDSKGNLYGTTAIGGNNFGIVFALYRSGGKWTERMLYNFCSRNNCSDGASPLAGLVMDANGALYGTTSSGGTGCSDCGVVFKLTRTNNTWKERVLHNFRGGSDGENPKESLILDRSGNIYGTTAPTVSGNGTVFEITP